MNIKCWICGKDHALYWTEGKDGVRKLHTNCNRAESWRTNRFGDARKELRHVTKVMRVTKEYMHLINGNPEDMELPVVVTVDRAKQLRDQNQFEMMPLLKRDHDEG